MTKDTNNLKATRRNKPPHELTADEQNAVQHIFILGRGDNAHAGVLFIHGFSATPQIFKMQIQALQEDGYTISAPLLPGHGTDYDDFAKASLDKWQQTVENAYQQLVLQCSKVVVVALSMGSSLSLLLANQHPEIKQLILVNPAVYEIPATWLPYKLEWLAKLIKKTRFSSKGADIKKADVYQYSYSALPLTAILALRKCMAIARKILPNVHTPTLIFNSTEDHVIGTRGAKRLFKALPSKEKSLIWLNNSYHVATLDNDADVITNGIKEKLETLNQG